MDLKVAGRNLATGRAAATRHVLIRAGVVAVVLLAGCGTAPGHAPARGTVTGRFVREGGPLGPGGRQPATRPLSGLVQFTGPGGYVASVRVGRTGTFTVSLPPGTYRVSGRSPDIMQVSDGGSEQEVPCSQPASVTVSAHRTTKLTLACVVP